MILPCWYKKNKKLLQGFIIINAQQKLNAVKMNEGHSIQYVPLQARVIDLAVYLQYLFVQYELFIRSMECSIKRIIIAI